MNKKIYIFLIILLFKSLGFFSHKTVSMRGFVYLIIRFNVITFISYQSLTNTFSNLKADRIAHNIGVKK